jgi:hypothetical protein
MKELKIASALLIGVTVILVAVAILFFMRTRNFLEGSLSAEGVVVDFGTRYQDGSTYYHPIVEYDLPNGETVVFQSGAGSKPPAYSVGEEVQVFYDPEDPKDARIDDWLDLYLVTLILGLMAFIFGILAAVFTFAAWRYRPAAPVRSPTSSPRSRQ